MLQEEINCSQGTDRETPNHEAEEVHSAMKAPQVEDSLLHDLSFNKFGLNSYILFVQSMAIVLLYTSPELSNLCNIFQYFVFCVSFKCFSIKSDLPVDLMPNLVSFEVRRVTLHVLMVSASLQVYRVKSWIDCSKRKPFGSLQKLMSPKRDGESTWRVSLLILHADRFFKGNFKHINILLIFHHM